MKKSIHAVVRMQQRGISDQVIDLITRFGTKSFDHRGGVTLFLNNAGFRRVRDFLGRTAFAAIERKLNSIVVLDCSMRTIITVAPRTRRIKRGK